MKRGLKRLIQIGSLLLAFLIVFAAGQVRAEGTKDDLIKKCDALLEDIDECRKHLSEAEAATGSSIDCDNEKKRVTELKNKIEAVDESDSQKLTKLEGSFEVLREEIPVNVDLLVNMSKKDAKAWILARNMMPGFREKSSDTVEKDYVIGPFSTGFHKIEFFNNSEDGLVTVDISTGPEKKEEEQSKDDETTSKKEEEDPSSTQSKKDDTTEGKENSTTPGTWEKPQQSSDNPLIDTNGSGSVGSGSGSDVVDNKSWFAKNWVLLLIIAILAIALIISMIVILNMSKKKQRKQLVEKRKGYSNPPKNNNMEQANAPAPSWNNDSFDDSGVVFSDQDEPTLLLSNVQSRGINAYMVSRRTGVEFQVMITARTVVGRATDCDCVINDPAFAPRHFMLEWDGESVYIDDLNTMTGTKLNGIPLRHKRRMESGDLITAGDSEYTIRW